MDNINMLVGEAIWRPKAAWKPFGYLKQLPSLLLQAQAKLFHFMFSDNNSNILTKSEVSKEKKGGGNRQTKKGKRLELVPIQDLKGRTH